MVLMNYRWYASNTSVTVPSLDTVPFGSVSQSWFRSRKLIKPGMQVIPAMQATNQTRTRIIMGMALVVAVALVAILPLIVHAFGPEQRIYRDGVSVTPKNPPPPPPPSNTGSSGSSGGSPPPPPSPPSPPPSPSTGSSGGSSNSGSTTTSSKTVTVTNTTTTVTIKETYTQVVEKTYVVDHYIVYYMYPIIKWTFTLTNIGQLQAPGHHSVGSEKLFTPGFGSGSGIFVPVYSQEAVYAFNIAPSTKPVITGWYVGKTSESNSPPQLTSQSVNTYLSGIQKSIQQVGNTVGIYNSGGSGSGTGNSGGTNTTTIINNVFIYWNTKPGSNNTQYVWITPYFYSKQDIITAFTDSAVSFSLGYQYAMKAGQDLLSGNWGQAGKDLFTSSYLTGLGLYQAARGAEMVAWNYLIAYPTLAWEYIVSNPNTPWSVAHALGVTGTMASFGAGTAVSALEAAGSYIANWFSHL